MMLFNTLLLPLKKAVIPGSSALSWFSDDFYVLLIRLG